MWSFRILGPGRLGLVEVSDLGPDELGEEEALLQVKTVGICGSDLPKFATASPPSADGWPAHELVGTVLASTDPGLHCGTRVVGIATSHQALSERVICSTKTVIPVDDGLDDVVAVLVQPLATAHAALAKVRALVGAHVSVLGLGGAGLMLGHLAKALGARYVSGVDLRDHRDVAMAVGFDEVAWSSSFAWCRATQMDTRPTVVIEAVGHQVATLNDAVALVADGGEVVGFGVPDDSQYPLEYKDFFRKNLSLTAGTTSRWPVHLAEAQHHLVKHPRLAEALLSRVLPIWEAQRGYIEASRHTAGVVKVVLDARSALEEG